MRDISVRYVLCIQILYQNNCNLKLKFYIESRSYIRYNRYSNAGLSIFNDPIKMSSTGLFGKEEILSSLRTYRIHFKDVWLSIQKIVRKKKMICMNCFPIGFTQICEYAFQDSTYIFFKRLNRYRKRLEKRMEQI
ncbi:hypothetical protein ABEB36_004066 [Hypothenemus hampei]|uniref:Uncharacterized protein n=1 Tax=Hypothenemus hampei TaxID=57062 RepID=A0ABD1F256_HYPHA